MTGRARATGVAEQARPSRAAGAARSAVQRSGPPGGLRGRLLRREDLLVLQRRVGNAAASALVAGRTPTVQRCGPVPCDCGPEEREAAEAATPGRGAAAAVQRVHEDFRIRGKEESSDTDSFYFDADSAVLDSAEAAKADSFAGTRLDGLRVRGLASEEEDPGLAAARVAAVAAELGRASPGTGEPLRQPVPAEGAGNSDYRSVRVVEVIPLSVPRIGPDCSQGAQVPCHAEPNEVTAARDRALVLIASARAALGTPGTGLAKVALDRFFGDTARAAEVETGLALIAAQLPRYAKEIPKGSTDRGGYRCVNECENILADNTGSGTNAVMTVGPRFLTSTDLDYQALTLVHEGSHAATGLETEDHAYSWQRLLPYLPVDKSLKNADSLTGVVAVIAGKAVGNSREPDSYDEDMAQGQRTMAASALGWLEHYLVMTRQDVDNVYGAMREAVVAGKWESTYYRNQVLPSIVAEFPEAALTGPLPTVDQTAVIAGIHERLAVLRYGLTDTPLQVFGSEDSGVFWDRENGQRGPGSDILLDASFFTTSAFGRVSRLLRAALEATAAVPESRREAYRKLILARGYRTGKPT